MSDLILHHYWPSPFAHKIRMTLGMIGASWTSVEIPRVPPKPLLMPLTAGYRRTPVLQIGADVYCDTANIARALGESGYADKLLPNAQRGRVMALASWIDQSVVELAIRIVITSAIGTAPPEFIQDRGDLYFGPGWTPEGMKAGLPGARLQLEAQMSHLDDALAETGHMVGDTTSYADAGVGFLAWFLRGRWDGGPALLARYANIERLEDQLATDSEGAYTDMTPEAALELAKGSTSSAPSGISNAACDFEVGQRIRIRQRTQSSDPDIFGTLRYLDAWRVSIDHHSAETGDVVVHLPVAGYQIDAA